MKVYYDRWGKRGYMNHFKVEHSNTLMEGNYIFSKLKSPSNDASDLQWNYELNFLKDGSYMFQHSSNLTSFNSNVKLLTDGQGMFDNCNNLISFESELSRLIDGSEMFRNCNQMSTFNSVLNELVNGGEMFRGCSSLTSFMSSLSKLKSGYDMFKGCKLDEDSFRNIAQTLNDIKSLDRCEDSDWSYQSFIYGDTSKNETIKREQRGIITIDCDETVSVGVINECKKLIISKGWIVYINGRLYTNPYDVSEINGYCPSAYTSDTDNWNENIYKKYNLFITKITKNGRMTNDLEINDFKYKGCKTVDDIKSVDSDYLTTDIVDGVWNEPLSDLEDGNPLKGNASGMFNNCESLTSFVSDLSSLINGYTMFRYCINLESFNSNLSSLMDGTGMFHKCSALTSFNSDLSGMTDGNSMFLDCSSLESFSSDLSSSQDGTRMFEGCTSLTAFNSDLSSLTGAYAMFEDCSNLSSFCADLSSLTDGWKMFYNCSNLTTFNSDLSSLTFADDMFYGCKLDTASVQNIADTIKPYSVDVFTGSIHIGIGNTNPNEQEEAAFNKMVSKGWTVYVNGSYSSDKWNPTSLISIDGEEQQTPIPFYAKPVQSDEEHAKYIDEQGNFFNILGGQFIYGDDVTTYGMFTSEEDAAANMHLTPYNKHKNEIKSTIYDFKLQK